MAEPRSRQYSQPIIAAPLASIRIFRRSSTLAPLRTAPSILPMPLSIFGWCAQISIGSMPLPCAGSEPVICFIARRMYQ